MPSHAARAPLVGARTPACPYPPTPQLADVSALAWGGYPQAERVRIAVARDELLAAARADPSQLGGVAALDVRGNFMFDAANHRDFLGALVGTG